MTFDRQYLARLRDGDPQTTQHLNGHFRRLIRLKFWGRVKPEREETLVDKVLAIALEGIKRGELADADCLPAYICRICSDQLDAESGRLAGKIRPPLSVTREQLRILLAGQP